MNAQGVCCPWRRFHPRTWYPDQVTQKVLASYNRSHCQPGWTGQTTGWRIGGRILTDFLRCTGFPPSSAKKSFLCSLSIKLVVYRHCFAVCILGTWTPSYWTRSGHPASSSTTWKRRCRRASSTSQLSSTWPTRSSHHPSYCRELFIEGGRSCVGGYVIVREADDHLQHGVLSLPLRCPTLPGQDPGQKAQRKKPWESLKTLFSLWWWCFRRRSQGTDWTWRSSQVWTTVTVLRSQLILKTWVAATWLLSSKTPISTMRSRFITYLKRCAKLSFF